METIKRFPRRKLVIAALVMIIVSFFFLDTYPMVASFAFIVGLLILIAILGFDIDHVDIRSKFESWKRRLL